MKKDPKTICIFIFIFAMVLSLFKSLGTSAADQSTVYYNEVQENFEMAAKMYKDAFGITPKWKGKCGVLVYWQLNAYGIFSRKDASTAYGKNMAKDFAGRGTSSTGCTLIGYPCNKNTASDTLDSIINDHNGSVKYLVVSFSPGNGLSNAGHVMLISRIKDGMVYFVDNTSYCRQADGSYKVVSMSLKDYKKKYFKWNVNCITLAVKPEEEEKAEDEAPVSEVNNDPITIDLTSSPVAIAKGRSCRIDGTISSSSNITMVYGAIIDLQGNFLQQTVDNPYEKIVRVRPLNLNQNLIFEKLAEGYYTLYIEVGDESHTKVFTQGFKVGNPAARCNGYATIGDGFYKIRTTAGKVFDVQDASTSYEANVQIYDDWNADNQIFWFSQQQDGSYMIFPKHDMTKAIDVSGGCVDNGTNIQLWGINASLAQKFYLFDNGNGTFIIASGADSKYVLDVQNMAEGTNNANIHLWERHGASNQTFILERVH